MTNARYRLPDPMCKHSPRKRVSAGDPKEVPHASTYVCDREPCIEDAKAWARASTHLEPTVVPLPHR